MTTSHTPGKLYVVESYEHWGRVNCHITAKHDDAMLGSIWCGTTSQNRADARRLVACWNACEGLPTSDLENSALPEIMTNLMEAKVQRDDLLEALKGLLSGMFDGPDESDAAALVAKARAAIAKAEWKA